MNGEGAHGFVEHHDAHDVWAVQLHGAKRWFVGPPIVSYPAHRYRWRDQHITAAQHMQEYITRAGQALYIPLGWRHYATPLSCAEVSSGAGHDKAISVHVTLGVQMPRWVDLLEGLLHQIGSNSPWLRQPLKFVPTQQGAKQQLARNDPTQQGQQADSTQHEAVEWRVSRHELRKRLRQFAGEATANVCGIALAGGAQAAVALEG